MGRGEGVAQIVGIERDGRTPTQTSSRAWPRVICIAVLCDAKMSMKACSCHGFGKLLGEMLGSAGPVEGALWGFVLDAI